MVKDDSLLNHKNSEFPAKPSPIDCIWSKPQWLTCWLLGVFLLIGARPLHGQELLPVQSSHDLAHLAPVSTSIVPGEAHTTNPYLPAIPVSNQDALFSPFAQPARLGPEPAFSSIGANPNSVLSESASEVEVATYELYNSSSPPCSASCSTLDGCGTGLCTTVDCCDAGVCGSGGVCPHCGRVHSASGSSKTFPTIKVTGLGQLDSVWFGQDATNRAVVGDLQDGSDIRRARLGATGDLSEKLGYMVELDFAFAQRLNITDVYLDIRDVPVLGTVRIGRWRLPFNMDALTSVKELTFLERSLPFTFAPFRQIGTGFMGITDTETTTWAASIFRFPTDQFGGNIGDNGGYSAVGRLTHAIPLGPMEQGTAFHMGGSYSLIDPANDMIRYSTPPEIGIGETGGGVPVGVPSSVPPFVDTGNLDVNLINLFDVELAMTVGSWHMQSELVYAVVDQMAGGSVAFPGVYAQTGYILTGETRPYNWKNAVLGRVVPNRPLGEGGWGAWELAVRGSRIDLSDQNVDGGKLTDVTAGLNWYLNRYAKIQLNYIHAFLDRPTSVDSNADIAAMRAQLDF